MTFGRGLPHMAGATDLERWADTRAAQGDLPILVRRLVRSENDQVQRVEMRGGDGVGLTGYDGFVEASKATSFVPHGFSVWEMGVGSDPEKKAQSDYRHRTDHPNGVNRAETTFVFVTPRRWEKKKDWEQRRRDEHIWRDVRVLDADDIEQALEVSPAVQVWLSELLGIDPFGATSIEDWWNRFSRGFSPALTTEVVLAGRDDQAGALLRRLSGDVGRTFIRAASVDDGLAFAACAMLMMGPENSEPMLARSLLIHDGGTLRRLEQTSSLLILLPYEEHLERDAHLVENHHVVFVTTERDGDVDVELPPLDHLALRAALSRAGVSELDLDRYMRAGNKSLLALRRVSSEWRDPGEWRADLADRSLRRVWLAGAWNQSRSGDTEVIEALAEADVRDLTDRLASVAAQPDPVFTKIGSTWAVTSPADSWRAARQLLSERDLDSLERAIQTVLGAVDPRLELPVSDRWLAAIHGKNRIHSRDLRIGLSRSLALLGVRGDELRISGGRTGRQWAERAASNLFERASQDESAQLWTSIEDVVPLLAEAAPDPFLRFFAKSTAGSEPMAKSFFQDSEGDWHSNSPHTGFLWALEALAWSERYVGYAAEVLAQLAEIDPGGRMSNRPAASLEGIFRPWFPQTSAPLATRLQTLDAIVRRHPRIAWDLLLGLIPEPMAFALESHHPEFRSWVPHGEPNLSRSEVRETVEYASERLLQLAEMQPSRWASLLPKLPLLPSASLKLVVDSLGRVDADELAREDRLILWEAANKVVIQEHKVNSESSPQENLVAASVRDLRDRLTPSKPSDAHRWLFEEWRPILSAADPDDTESYEEQLQSARDAAVLEILEEEGWLALLEFAATVRLPWAVGFSLARTDQTNEEQAFSLLDSPNEAWAEFGRAYARARLGGESEFVASWVSRFDGRPQVQARLLLTANDVEEAWHLARESGSDVERAYWDEFMPYGYGSDTGFLNESARQLMVHGRVAMALDVLSMRAWQDAGVDIALIVEALDKFGTEADPESARISSHDITALIQHLESHGVAEDTVARFEWKYLPYLLENSSTQTLQALLARDPQTFAELIELVFRPASADPDTPGPTADRNVSTLAYRLLRAWKVVPGSRPDGTVDEDALFAWLEQVRALLLDADRIEVGELQIGEVLAYAPEDPDGTFPTLAVRNALEEAPNDRLERGFSIGLFNKRGMTSRSMTEGGAPEYRLSERYEAWAAAVQATHPRTATVLREVAEEYRSEGRRNDDEVKRHLEGLGF